MKKTKLFVTALISMFAFTCGVKAVEVSTAEELKSCLTKDGNTCTLKENIETSGLELTGQTITLDLNEKNITFTKGSRFNVKKGDLTITGKGKISEGVLGTSPIAISGSTDVKDTKYTTVTINKDVTVEGFYGAFVTINKDENGISHAYGVTVNINGTLIGLNKGTDLGSGFYVNGQNKDITNAPVININKSADLSGDGGSIYAAGYAVWNINEAKLAGKAFGVGIKAGKFVFNGTTVETNGEKKDSSYDGNGINGIGAALQIESNNGYAGEIEIDIKGGSYKSANDGSIYHYSAEKDGKLENVKNSLKKLTIENGTFSGDIVFLNDDKVTITGGTFSADVTKYAADKYIVKKTNNGYEVTENKVLTTTDEKITFESEEALDSDLKLEVNEKTKEELAKGSEKVTEAYKENKKVKDVKLINLYEINVVDGIGVVVMEEGKFTISIAIPESEQKYSAYKVLYFNESGEIAETIDAKLVDGKVVFTTTHLSTYGIVGYNNVVVENPKTSDINLALILASLGIASVGAVLVSRKKIAKANR